MKLVHAECNVHIPLCRGDQSLLRVVVEAPALEIYAVLACNIVGYYKIAESRDVGRVEWARKGHVDWAKPGTLSVSFPVARRPSNWRMIVSAT